MLTVNKATKYYKEYIGLEKATLSIGGGEIVGVLGSNGSGKTTLLKSIMNIINLTSGSITLDDKPIQGDNYRKLSYITEEGSFFTELTPTEHADFFKNMLDSFDEGRYYKLLEFFNLPLDKKAGTFSRGQKVKLEVAIGFSKGAKFILMDEPFSGNDIFTRRDLIKLMISLLKDDESIIIATHLVDEIENLLSRAIIIDNGRIKCDIFMEELQQQGQSLFELMKHYMNYSDDRINQIEIE